MCRTTRFLWVGRNLIKNVCRFYNRFWSRTSAKTSWFAINAAVSLTDRKYEATILPIHGIATPFHISTLKVYIMDCDGLCTLYLELWTLITTVEL